MTDDEARQLAPGDTVIPIAVKMADGHLEAHVPRTVIDIIDNGELMIRLNPCSEQDCQRQKFCGGWYPYRFQWTAPNLPDLSKVPLASSDILKDYTYGT